MADAASRLGVSSETIRREIRDGQLAALRVRGAIRITEQDLCEYEHRARLAARRPVLGIAPPPLPWGWIRDLVRPDRAGRGA